MHDVHDICGQLRGAAVFVKAIIQINGADAIEDADPYAMIPAVVLQLLKGTEGGPVIAPGGLARPGVIGYLGSLSVPLLIAPVAEAAIPAHLL